MFSHQLQVRRRKFSCSQKPSWELFLPSCFCLLLAFLPTHCYCTQAVASYSSFRRCCLSAVLILGVTKHVCILLHPFYLAPQPLYKSTHSRLPFLALPQGGTAGTLSIWRYDIKHAGYYLAFFLLYFSLIKMMCIETRKKKKTTLFWPDNILQVIQKWH